MWERKNLKKGIYIYISSLLASCSQGFLASSDTWGYCQTRKVNRCMHGAPRHTRIWIYFPDCYLKWRSTLALGVQQQHIVMQTKRNLFTRFYFVFFQTITTLKLTRVWLAARQWLVNFSGLGFKPVSFSAWTPNCRINNLTLISPKVPPFGPRNSLETYFLSNTRGAQLSLCGVSPLGCDRALMAWGVQK